MVSNEPPPPTLHRYFGFVSEHQGSEYSVRLSWRILCSCFPLYFTLPSRVEFFSWPLAKTTRLADTSFELAPLLSQIGEIVAPTSWYFGAKQLRSVLFYLHLHMFAYHYGETNVQAFYCNLFFFFSRLPPPGSETVCRGFTK